MIADGMGDGHRDLASLYRHGRRQALFLEGLDHSGRSRTASRGGITDSAAAATALATGTFTWNGYTGMGPNNETLSTVLGAARDAGLGVGIVTTTLVPHATVAAFTANVRSRYNYAEIAAQQARMSPDVILGGGSEWFSRRVLRGLEDRGAAVVSDRDALQSHVPGSANGLVGIFASEHLPYEAARSARVPSLAEMTLAALDELDENPEGFLLVVEGGRIDHAAHDNRAAEVVHETLAFDDAVRAAADWADGRADTTLLVTSDHETGGLDVVGDAPAGTLATVRWRWRHHTNRRVGVWGRGPLTAVFDGEVVDHAWVHGVVAARISGAQFAPPQRPQLPDGELDDMQLAWTTPAAVVVEKGVHAIRSLHVGAGTEGLQIGVGGDFSWDDHGVAVWIDLDPGAGTGHTRLGANLRSRSGRALALASGATLATDSATFGAEILFVTARGAEAKVERQNGSAGVWDLRPRGGPERLPAAVTFGETVRREEARPPAAFPLGVDTVIPWEAIAPNGNLDGREIAVLATVIVGDGEALAGTLPSIGDQPAWWRVRFSSSDETTVVSTVGVERAP